MGCGASKGAGPPAPEKASAPSPQKAGAPAPEVSTPVPRLPAPADGELAGDGSPSPSRETSLAAISERYDVETQLGTGAYAQVWLATHKPTGKRLAVKIVEVRKLGEKQRQDCQREVAMLKMLSHSYVVGLEDVMETPAKLVLGLEYLRGGELFDHIDAVAGYTEATVARLFSQVVSAVRYLHQEQSVIHRDIKPENVVFSYPPAATPAEELTVKLIDFGSAVEYDPNAPPHRGIVGTAGFAAPEVLRRQEHTFKLDIFSLGSLLFCMLTGSMPWPEKECDECTYVTIPFEESANQGLKQWMSLSQEARDLIAGCLKGDPAKRWDILEVADCKWLVDGTAPADPDIGAQVAADLKRMLARRRLRRAGQAVIFGTSIRRMSVERRASLERRKSLEEEADAAIKDAAEAATARAGTEPEDEGPTGEGYNAGERRGAAAEAVPVEAAA